MFLTQTELRDLTGYRVSPKQASWLREHRWRFHVNAAGKVVVARAYFEKRMVGETALQEAPVVGPDFAVLDWAG